MAGNARAPGHFQYPNRPSPLDQPRSVEVTLRFEPGTILAIDRGHNDYEWFRELTTEEVYFVLR